MFAQVMPAPVPAGGRLVSVDGRTLPLRGTRIDADACAGLCRVTLVQRFLNVFAEPLHVTYQVPLPADGAVSGYSFELAGERTVGVVKSLPDARQTFQRAVMQGRTAALLEQDRSSLFTQSLGNIPPGEEVVVTLTIDQPLAWEDGGWTWRFPTCVAPRYQNQATPDPQRQTVEIADGDTGVRTSLRLAIRDQQTGAARSPSHGVGGHRNVELDGAALDRDVVVKWPVAAPKPGVTVDSGTRDGKQYALLTVVPPSVPMTPVARDLIVLLDTSGSMGGEPLKQAVAVVEALLDTLNPFDQLEMIEFSSRARNWNRGAVGCTPRNLKSARKWLHGLRASGGTEMHSGIMAALAGLRPEAQRQVVLITDGLIGFEQQIIGEVAHRLPAGSRVHTVGIGSSVNRSLTGPTARAGRGVEVIVPPYTEVDSAVRTLVSRTAAPQVVDLMVEGGTGPARLPDLYAGSPARIALEVPAEGGPVTVRGRTAEGLFEQTVQLPPTNVGSQAVPTLFGREMVEDLELARAAGGGSSLDQTIEALGVQFQIVTRMTAFVAVTQRVTVDPTAPTRAENVPHALAQGVSAEGVGLRSASGFKEQAVDGFGGAVPGAAAPMPLGGAKKSKLRRARSVPAAPSAIPPARAPSPPVVESEAFEDADDLAADLEGAVQASVVPVSASTGQRSTGGGGPREEAKAELLDEEESLAAAEAPQLPPQRVEAPPAPAPRSASQPERKKGRGLSRLFDKLRRAARKLGGRLALRDDDRWVIEFEVDGPLAWDPPANVTVTLADGRTITCAVDFAVTTGPASLSAGHTGRLALVHGDSSLPTSVDLGGLVIDL